MAKETVETGFFYKVKPYMYVVLGYAAALLILVLIIDNFIMPSIVHSNEKVKVPRVIGEKLESAEMKLKQRGLNSKISREIYSEKFAEGSVVSQTPNPNLEVKAGRPIFLVVSKGKETVPVPYLIGSNIRNARISLMQRGLELGDISYQFNEYYPKDTIVSQSRNAGDYVPYGSKINITISKGSETQNRIPMLIGFSYEEINAVVLESGFVVGNITYQSSETYLPNTIIDQNPKADQSAPPGTAINVVISK